MQKILLIGNFLSNVKGTKAVSESIAESELSNNFDFQLVSRYQSQFLRLVDMTWRIISFKDRTIHIDVFSGRAFRFASIISFIAVLRNKRVIMTLHGGALPEYTNGKKKFVKRVLKRANYLQTPSKYLKEYYGSIGISVHYLPNPIDLKRFPYKRTEVKPFSLLWVRAFSTIYNPNIPVRVLKSLLENFPEATLTMVGPDKGIRKRTQNLVEELGVVGRVKFVGPIPNDELCKYYQTHHVFLNTTSYESFGVAVVEAAACGIPIVSNRVGELPYLWKNGTDILFAEKNKESNYIKQVENIFTIPELGPTLSRNARAKAEQFDLLNVINNWKIILE